MGGVAMTGICCAGEAFC